MLTRCSGEFLEIALDMVRREIEHCDYNPILLSLHSLAGGTGSGLGARMTLALRDEYRYNTRANLAILPYHFGEVVVQHYNALLSLSTITSASHGVLLFENEVAQQLCKTMKGNSRPSLHDINAVISANIVPILLPKINVTNRHTSVCLDRDLEHLCCHPGYRILDVKTTPQTSDSSVQFTFDAWSALLRGLLYGPDGAAFSPTHTRKGGRLYRYYVSQTVLKHGAGSCPIGRVPAGEIEAAVIDQLRAVFRQPEIVAGTWKAAHARDGEITEANAREALMGLDPLWDQLFPAEQARIVALLVERVDIGTTGLSLRLRVDGMAGLAREMCAEFGAAA
jgi:hypothetical protein